MMGKGRGVLLGGMAGGRVGVRVPSQPPVRVFLLLRTACQCVQGRLLITST